ncbi:MAG TPA: hypothetical protein VMI72_15345 [Roseiarcus sp.]|nr:hypothetical protein [Roseiarcus sp.]
MDKVLAAPERLSEIIAGLGDPDPVARMRAAEVAENGSAVHPEWLAPHWTALLRRMRATQERKRALRSHR